MAGFVRKVHGDQEFAGDSAFRKFRVERLINDPEIKFAGRSWYNTTDKRYKYSSLDESGELTVRTFACIDDLIKFSNGGFGWRGLVAPFEVGRHKKNYLPTWEPFRGGIYAFTFKHNKYYEIFSTFHMNHDYMVGTMIFPRLHWSPQDSRSGVVRWGIEYTVAKSNGTESFPLTTTVYIEQSTSGKTYDHIVAEVDDEDGILSGLGHDSIILCRIFRDAKHWKDTYPGKAYLHSCNLHYLANQLASPERNPT